VYMTIHLEVKLHVEHYTEKLYRIQLFLIPSTAGGI